jgi:hypothetical protein
MVVAAATETLESKDHDKVVLLVAIDVIEGVIQPKLTVLVRSELSGFGGDEFLHPRVSCATAGFAGLDRDESEY